MQAQAMTDASLHKVITDALKLEESVKYGL